MNDAAGLKQKIYGVLCDSGYLHAFSSVFFSDASKPTAPEVLKWMKDLNDWFSVGEKVSTS